MTDSNEDVLEQLKAEAKELGIQHHPSIGVAKLREKIQTHQARYAQPAEPAPAPAPAPVAAAPAPVAAPVTPKVVELTDAQKRRDLLNRCRKLVRVRVTNMNPNKREWEGEIICAANAVVGSMKKYVPYDVEWHVPQLILNVMESRQCQIFSTVTNERGMKVRQGKLVKEFNIEKLPPLSKGELDKLAQRQAMAAGNAYN